MTVVAVWQAHKGLTQMLKKYTFVGMVDLHLSLIQFNTKLVLVNHTELRQAGFESVGRPQLDPGAASASRLRIPAHQQHK